MFGPSPPRTVAYLTMEPLVVDYFPRRDQGGVLVPTVDLESQLHSQ